MSNLKAGLVNESHGYSIEALSQSISLALAADGAVLAPEAISRLFREAAIESDIELPEGGDFIDPLHMFALYADFTEMLGRALGCHVEPEGFALDWADPYPNLVGLCKGISSSAVKHMEGLSERFSQKNGYSLGEVFLKTVGEGVSPEVAAASLQLDRQKPKIH